ncbi:MAG: hypothetical protein HY043_00645, partial [Verrucomicrobia bacterium]|nr:hypothetical protein [Verrucomicrobiota bacterium]
MRRLLLLWLCLLVCHAGIFSDAAPAQVSSLSPPVMDDDADAEALPAPSVSGELLV